MPAELIDLNGEFYLGNYFTLETAEKLSEILDDSYRIIVKYGIGNRSMPSFDDDKKNVIISTSAETHTTPDEFYRDDVFTIFQHYFMLDDWGDPIHNPLVFPMPLGCFRDATLEDILPLPDRKYDFCFMGQIPHTGTRDCFKRNLDKLIEETGDKFKFYVNFTDGFSKGLEKEEYFDILGNSKLSLCPQGAESLETFRFFESLAVGAIPVVESLPKVWHYEEAPFFKAKWRDLDACLSKILNYLQTRASRDMLYAVATYSNQVLNPEKLAIKLKEQLKIRESNFYSQTDTINQIRKEIANEF
jgi:hypothetical protein